MRADANHERNHENELEGEGKPLGRLEEKIVEPVGEEHLPQLRLPVGAGDDVEVHVQDLVHGRPELLLFGGIGQVGSYYLVAEAAHEIHGGVDVVPFELYPDVGLADALEVHEVAVIVTAGEEVGEPSAQGAAV